MKHLRTYSFTLAALLVAHSVALWANDSNEIFRAMRDELKRSMSELQLQSLGKPYYIEYSVKDQRSYDVRASFGSLVESEQTHQKTLTAGVRVGTPEFDNTNFFDVGLNFFGSSDDEERFRNRRIPNELDYEALRRELWLATDAAYKQSSELLAKKQAALQNRLRLDTTPDFRLLSKETQKFALPHPLFNQTHFEQLCKDLSAVFREYPAIALSRVGVEFIPNDVYYVNSEGREYTKTSLFTGIEIVATAQAEGGMPVAETFSAYSLDPANLPSRDSLMRATHAIAKKLTEMVTAPIVEAYSGPVLFEGQAAAEMVAHVFSPNLVTQRSMVTDGGLQDNMRYAAFQNKIGGRVLPEFLSVDVRPTQQSYEQTPLIGTYVIDDEGILAQDFTIVKDGYLKGLMSSRVPTKRVRESNGHQRGGAAMMSIIDVSSKEEKQLSNEALRQRVLELCKARELPYGIIVRKALNQNLLFTTLFQLTSGEYPFTRGESTVPLLEVYKLYADGREELVRGCEAAGLSPQSFKDILAVGKTTFAYNYLAAAVTSPFITGGSQFIGSSILTPDILFEDLEIRPVEADFAKPPILPHPYFSENKK